jgi:cysteine-rich repeat protein
MHIFFISQTTPAPGITKLVVPATTCGDGLRTGAEDCDDANVHSDDGCSSLCVTEAGFACKRPAAGGKDECSAIASPPAGSVFISASIRLGASMTPEQFVGVYTHTHTHTHTHIVHTHIRMYMYTCIHRPRPQHIPANDCG